MRKIKFFNGLHAKKNRSVKPHLFLTNLVHTDVNGSVLVWVRGGLGPGIILGPISWFQTRIVREKVELDLEPEPYMRRV